MLQHLPDQFHKKAVETLSPAKKSIQRLITEAYNCTNFLKKGI